jgi:hypothetical protein
VGERVTVLRAGRVVEERRLPFAERTARRVLLALRRLRLGAATRPAR